MLLLVLRSAFQCVSSGLTAGYPHRSSASSPPVHSATLRALTSSYSTFNLSVRQCISATFLTQENSSIAPRCRVVSKDRKSTLLFVSLRHWAYVRRFSRNNTKCGFLQLPCEIRNRIYSLALTGFTLHITHATGRRFSVCRRPQAVGEEARDLRLMSKTVSATSYEDRHRDCFGPGIGSAKPAVALLQTCRRIHSEAGLLPFSGNSFTFGHENSPPWDDHALIAGSFVYNIMLEQARAIQHVVLHFPLPYLTKREGLLETLLSRVGNIEHITCYVEINWIAWYFLVGEWRPSVRPTLTRNLMRLRTYGTAKIAHIPLYFIDPLSPGGKTDWAGMMMAKRWSAEMEHQLESGTRRDTDVVWTSRRVPQRAWDIWKGRL